MSANPKFAIWTLAGLSVLAPSLARGQAGPPQPAQDPSCLLGKQLVQGGLPLPFGWDSWSPVTWQTDAQGNLTGKSSDRYDATAQMTVTAEVDAASRNFKIDLIRVDTARGGFSLRRGFDPTNITGDGKKMIPQEQQEKILAWVEQSADEALTATAERNCPAPPPPPRGARPHYPPAGGPEPQVTWFDKDRASIAVIGTPWVVNINTKGMITYTAINNQTHDIVQSKSGSTAIITSPNGAEDYWSALEAKVPDGEIRDAFLVIDRAIVAADKSSKAKWNKPFKPPGEKSIHKLAEAAY